MTAQPRIAQPRIAQPRIRRNEWQGILRRVRSHTPAGPGTRRLDYGCVTGGLLT